MRTVDWKDFAARKAGGRTTDPLSVPFQRRWVASILVLFLAFGFGACSDDVSDGTNDPTGNQNGDEQDVGPIEDVDDDEDAGDDGGVEDADGDEDADAEPEGEPVAVAGDDQTVEVGETVYFDATESYHEDPDFAITSYEWNFQDIGMSPEGAQVERNYQEEGSYVVTLTVRDDYGGSDSDALVVEVVEGTTDPPTGGKAKDGDYDSEDEWIMRPYDTDGQTTTTCGMSQVILEPRTCTIDIDAPDITKYCTHMGGDDVYVGEITGDNTFYLELERRDQDSDFPSMCPNGFYFTEYIEAEFVDADRWEGTSEMGVVYNDPDCASLSCEVPNHPITGERE